MNFALAVLQYGTNKFCQMVVYFASIQPPLQNALIFVGWSNRSITLKQTRPADKLIHVIISLMKRSDSEANISLQLQAVSTFHSERVISCQCVMGHWPIGELKNEISIVKSTSVTDERSYLCFSFKSKYITLD
jgi:hypothetical protein